MESLILRELWHTVLAIVFILLPSYCDKEQQSLKAIVLIIKTPLVTNCNEVN